MHRIVMAIAVVLLFAAGCGDDSSGGGRFETSASDSDGGDEDSGSSDDSSGDSADTGDSAATGDSADTGDSAATGDSADSGASSDGGGSDESAGAPGSGSEFCGLNADINDGLDGMNLFGGPDSVEEAFRQIAENIDQATSRAPAEIRDDVQILSEGVAGFIEVLEEYEFNFLAIPDDAVATDPRLAAVEDPAYEAAADRVNAYCGFEDDSGATADEPGTTDDEGLPDFGDAGLDSDFLAQIYQEAFGWDAELATCVVEELGLSDPTGAIDPSVFADPNAEVCGRSLAELFGGG
jgi:hypothetical protein